MLKSYPAMPKTCVVCGNPLTGRQKLRCPKHLKWTYLNTCQCGCGQQFYTPHKNQRYLNMQHWGNAQRGKKSHNYRHGYFMRDPITKKQDSKKVRKWQNLNKEPLHCPICKKVKLVPKNDARKQKCCSHRCAGILIAKGRKRDKKGRFT